MRILGQRLVMMPIGVVVIAAIAGLALGAAADALVLR
jgi:hypothetical protein